MKKYMHVPIVVAWLSLPLSSAYAEPASPAASSVNLNDTQVTKTEKNLDEVQTQNANKFAKQQAQVLSTVPGVKIDPEELKEQSAKKKGISINPIRWLFAPVIKLEEQTMRLQQLMMKLTGPIAALQPAMLTLQERVEAMGGQMKDVQNELHGVKEEMHGMSGQLTQTVDHLGGVDANMGKVSGQMSSVQSSIKGTYSELVHMRPDLASVRTDIGRIRDPIMQLQQPLKSMAKPLISLDKEVAGVHEDISAITAPLVHIEKPISSLDKQLTGLHSEISELRNLLGMVLSSIFISAFMIAIGTPIAAILLWKHRDKFMSAKIPTETPQLAKPKSSRPY